MLFYNNELSRIKGLSFILLIASFLFGLSIATHACILKITPSTFTTAVGEAIEFQLERQKSCGRCTLPLEETKIEITGGELVAQKSWKTGKPDVLSFKVNFTTVGSVAVSVTRDCSKSLNAVKATGNVSSPEQFASQNSNSLLINNVIESPVETNTLNKPATQPTSSVTEQSRPEKWEPLQLLRPSSSPTEEVAPIFSDGNNSGSTPKSVTEKSWRSPLLDFFWWILIFPAALLFYLLRKTRLRRGILFLSMISLGFYSGGCPCAVGAVFNLVISNAPKILPMIVLLVIPIGASLIWGRFFCGWFCPLGAVQEFIHGKSKNHRNITKMDRILKFLKYIVLMVFIYLSWKVGSNVFCRYEPFKALFSFAGTTVTIAVLIIILTASVFIERPFCRYLCPFGAILSLTSRLAIIKIRLNKEACVCCGICAKSVCPVSAIEMDTVTKLPVINHSECINCLRCVETCRPKALNLNMNQASDLKPHRSTRMMKEQ